MTEKFAEGSNEQSPEVWDGELPDVWDGPSAEEPTDGGVLAAKQGPASLTELYADLPKTGAGAGETFSIGPPPAEDPSTPLITRFIAHVVVPGATIVMVSAFLFFLYDVRSVFLPGSPALKWIGMCFASATVLIARYSRMERDVEGSTSFYTVALGGVTVLAMWISPWEPPGAGLLGGLSNLLIVFLVWRFATALTRHLAADLDRPPVEEVKLYGLDRLEMETWRHQSSENRTSIYDIGRRRRQHKKPRADGRAASRAVAKLSIMGLVVFALCERVLLAGSPEIAGRALGAVIVFLFASGVVMAAAAAVFDQQRLVDLGVRAGFRGLVGRVGLAALVMICILSVALGLPGLQFRGSGEIVARRAEDGMSANQGDAAESESQQSDSSDDSTSENTNKSQGSQGSWVGSLAALGQWLRWPVYALLALGILLALWRFGPNLLAALKEKRGGWWSKLLDRFRGKDRASSGTVADPLARVASLAGAAPRETVLEAYAVWLDVCAHLGQPRAEGQTPLEMLASLPRHLRELRPAGERLTRLYLTAAYGTRQVDEEVARNARGAVDELALLVRKLEGPSAEPLQ